MLSDYENLVGKMFEVQMSSGRKELALIVGIQGSALNTKQYLVYWPERMLYDTRTIPGILQCVQHNKWIEV